jgi:ribonuclease D
VQLHHIQDLDKLNSLCEILAQSSVLTVDTEFVRTRTLYPRLGLLQVSNGEHAALIDPIAIDDLSAFWSLLTDENIVKVLHACSEDLEVFLTAANCKPVNVIDSQIIMSFLGHGLSLGYAAMVNHYLEIELDKSESRTDWTKRPLTDRQLEYARADVTYLYQIYPKLIAEIESAGWLEAAKQETNAMIERKFTPINADELYQNVKMAWRLNPVQLNRLKYLTAWRFEQAKKRDLPISFVVKDHTLLAVAQHNPANVGVMAGLEGAEVLDVRHKGKAMLHVLKKAEQIPESDYPEKITRLDEYPGYKQTFKKVKSFLTRLAEDNKLTIENVASKKQINQFLAWHYGINGMRDKKDSVDLLLNWRNTLFGEKLLAFANNGFK